MEHIGPRVIGQVAGDIEALLNENQSELNRAYIKFTDDPTDSLKVSIGVRFSADAKGVATEYSLSFPKQPHEAPEKISVKRKVVLSEGQIDIPGL